MPWTRLHRRVLFLGTFDPPPRRARDTARRTCGVQVFKATTKEDFKDVVKLLPENTPLPASNKMTYLIARLELHPAVSIQERLSLVNEQGVPMADAVGPAVGCLMATFGTNMISSCIFDFDDPEDLEEFAVEERIELWGLQVLTASAVAATVMLHNCLCRFCLHVDVSQASWRAGAESAPLLPRLQLRVALDLCCRRDVVVSPDSL